MYAELVRTKVCKKCQMIKSLDEFYISSKSKKVGKLHPRSYCRPCDNERHRNYVEKNKEKINSARRKKYHLNTGPVREQGYRRKYKIDIKEYDILFENQKGCCAICGLHQSMFERRFDIDHNHETMKIRGLLCIRCNRGIGLMQDSVEILMKAVNYLKNKN